MSFKMKAFSCPGFMVTFPVMVLMMAESSPDWLIAVSVGAGDEIFLSGVIVVTWLDMMSWPLISIAFVPYF